MAKNRSIFGQEYDEAFDMGDNGMVKLPWSDAARGLLATAAVVSLSLVTGCTSGSPSPEAPSSATSETVTVDPPVSPVTVLSSTDAAELALASSQAFFTTTPVVVIATAQDPEAQATAAAAAYEVTGPVLLVGGGVSDDGVVTELRRLSAVVVIVVSSESGTEAAQEKVLPQLSELDDVSTIALDTGALDPDSDQINARDLREMTEALPPDLAAPRLSLQEALALVEGTPEQVAAKATAKAAGAWPLDVPGGDPRASAEVVQRISEAKALNVVGIGPSFGSVEDLEWKFDVAETGAKLPGGGQLVFPERRIVSTSVPATSTSTTSATRSPSPSSTPEGPDPAIADAVTAAQDAASAFSEASPDELFIPAIELPATIASGTAGPDEDYSQSVPVEELQPFIDAGLAAGVYVVLRFEPGAATFAEQVATYAEVLTSPGVGVAFDVSSRRGESAKDRGTVTAAELNEAFTNLAQFVRDRSLPQMLVVVQQGRPENIVDRETLQVGAGELAIVLDVQAKSGASVQAGQWTDNLTNAPVGLHGGWTTMSKDPATEVENIESLAPFPSYIAGSD